MLFQKLGYKKTPLSCWLSLALLLAHSCWKPAALFEVHDGNIHMSRNGGSPSANSSPWGIESHQQPWEWACKLIVFQASLWMRLQPGWHIYHRLLREFEAEAHNLVVPWLSWGYLSHGNIQLILHIANIQWAHTPFRHFINTRINDLIFRRNIRR